MSKISESAKDIYSFLGEGYGFNGSEEDALKILDEKITSVAMHYANIAFVAGRSKMQWKHFYLNTFLSDDMQEKLIEIGLLCDGNEYCQCASESMDRGANRDIVESYERNCPNQPI